MTHTYVCMYIYIYIYIYMTEQGDDCGKGFDNLNEGSQKYFGTLKVPF